MLRRVHDHDNGEAGFTLIELLVVMVIMGIIGAFTATSLVQGMRTSHEADRRVQALTDLQQAGQRVSRELRMACHVETALADQVVVDVLRDGSRWRYDFAVDASGELSADVYTVASDGTATFDRTQPIAQDIVDIEFMYRDGAGALTTIASQIRDITLTLERATRDSSVMWDTDLHLRNGGLSCGF